MEYHRVRSSAPEVAAGFAPVRLEDAERHRDGLSCRTTVAYTYDANGRGRWCIDCGEPLGEEASWHPDGANVPTPWIGVAITILGLLLLMVVLAVSGPTLDDPPPAVTPTTCGPPTRVVGS